MDQVENYAHIVRRIMDEFADYIPHIEGVELERIYEEVYGHYELLLVGWEGRFRTHGIMLHLDIHGGKVWIQHDGTSAGVADNLVKAGVPKDKIVLGFHPPYKRAMMEFAVG